MTTNPTNHATLLLVACGALGGCIATPTTFVLEQPQVRERFEQYQVRFQPIADDPEIGEGLKEDFEAGLAAGFDDVGGLKRTASREPTDRTLVLRYRAAGLSGGSLVLRAGTAAVNAFLPVGVVPEIGGGDLGVETTFLDREGGVVGRVLVQADVHGLLNTDALTMRKIGVYTAEYAARRFSGDAAAASRAVRAAVAAQDAVVNLSPDKARQELAVFDPYVGVWDMQYEIESQGKPSVRSHVVENNRWEAGGRIMFQFAETQDVPEKLFRCNAIYWDPITHQLHVFQIDSAFGAHESHAVSIERNGNVLRGVCKEPERITELVEVFAEDGLSRTGTKTVWSADRSKLLLQVRVSGRKRP